MPNEDSDVDDNNMSGAESPHSSIQVSILYIQRIEAVVSQILCFIRVPVLVVSQIEIPVVKKMQTNQIPMIHLKWMKVNVNEEEAIALITWVSVRLLFVVDETN